MHFSRIDVDIRNIAQEKIHTIFRVTECNSGYGPDKPHRQNIYEIIVTWNAYTEYVASIWI